MLRARLRSNILYRPLTAGRLHDLRVLANIAACALLKPKTHYAILIGRHVADGVFWQGMYPNRALRAMVTLLSKVKAARGPIATWVLASY